MLSSFPKKIQIILFLVCAVVLIILPFLVGPILGNAWVRTLDFALLYILLALGLNIVVGFAGLLDLGYIAFYAVGAYTYALLNSPQFGIFLPWWMVLPLGAACAALFGILLGTPVLKLRGDYLAIVTLGFGEIVRIFINNLNAPVNITNGPQGINLIRPIEIAGISLGKTQQLAGITFHSLYLYYYFFLILVVLSVILCYRLQHSRIGRAWVALREDDIAASAMGINIRNIKLLAFSMGATFWGLSGGLFASFQGFVSPESFGLLESIMVLAMVVLGGMGHLPGIILGAVLLTALPEVLRSVIGPLQMKTLGYMIIDPETARMLLFGLALILVMLLRPEGLWPSKRRKAELRGEIGPPPTHISPEKPSPRHD